MTYKPKTWNDKLKDKPGYPKIIKFETNFPCSKALINWGAKKGDTVVITQALEVNEVMSKVPKGKVITLKGICEQLAKKHKTKWCCPLVAGIHAVICANASAESGNKMPWWRTVKNDGELNPKFPAGQKELLEKEGHELIIKGKKTFLKED